MSNNNFRNRSVSAHQFSMIPRADIPRATFRIEHAHKTTFDAGLLVPVYVDEILPGDQFSLDMTAFARMATPLFPMMDNMKMTSFFFFVPNRLVWDNWQRFMGERPNPDSSTDFVVPQCVSPAGGYAVNSLQDYMGLPTVGQVTAGKTVSHNALFLRAYNLIYNEWFRDENLQNSLVVHTDDGPDPAADYVIKRRGKRHDYFTSALPWPQKGNSVTLPLGSQAPVMYSSANGTINGKNATLGYDSGSTAKMFYGSTLGGNSGQIPASATGGLYADLSQASAATINQIRQSFQVQRLLERDARGGTRYTEIVRSHFGVISPDARLQRPEYLGGSTVPIAITPIAQTSATAATGSDTPQGNLAAMGTALANRHGFTHSFTEHGMVIGMVCIDADLTYQQGMRKMWSRNTRYDYYFPVFSHLGEQPVLNREIYTTGDTSDTAVFGYQERWAEYRYHPSMITGLFRSTASGTLDPWHLAQRFNTLPTLSPTFIESNPPVARVVAVGAEANGQQFIFDSVFSCRATRAMPLYSVPGLIDHF